MHNIDSKIYLFFSAHNIPAEHDRVLLTNFVLNLLQHLNYEKAYEAMDLNSYKKSRNMITILKTLRQQFEKPFEFVYCLN